MSTIITKSRPDGNLQKLLTTDTFSVNVSEKLTIRNIKNFDEKEQNGSESISFLSSDRNPVISCHEAGAYKRPSFSF